MLNNHAEVTNRRYLNEMDTFNWTKENFILEINSLHKLYYNFTSQFYFPLKIQEPKFPCCIELIFINFDCDLRVI